MNPFVCSALFVILSLTTDLSDPGGTEKVDPELDRTRKNIARSIESIEAAFEERRFVQFVDQMVRANQLSIIANRLDGWVYASGFEEMIEEFEAARNSIQLAESYLRRDFESQGSLSLSASPAYRNDFVESAKYELDSAEYSIHLLLAISMSQF